MKKLLTVMVFMLLLLGCSQRVGLYRQYDEFTKIELVYLDPVENLDWEGRDEAISGEVALALLTGEGSGAVHCARIIPGYTAYGGEYSYFLKLEYQDNDWLFLNNGESLWFLLDGLEEPIMLTTDEVLRGTSREGDKLCIQEIAYYDITLDFIKLLADSFDVRLRLDGEHEYAVFYFREENFEDFKTFLSLLTE